MSAANKGANQRTWRSMLIILGLCSWAVTLYSMRVALFGNPLQRLMVRTPRVAFQHAHELAEAGRLQPGTPESCLLQTFSHLTLLEIAAFVFELAVLVYLLCASPVVSGTFWLALALFGKDLLAAGFSMIAARRQRGAESMIDYLYGLPGWLVRLDRLSSLVSGVGFAALFLVAAGVVGT